MRVFRYQHPVHPFPIGRQTAEERSGLLLALEDDSGVRWAEASPLPGWSVESVDDVIDALRDNDLSRFPSLRWGMDCLENQPSGKIRMPIAGLVTGQPNDAEFACGVIKLKVGRLPSIMDDISRVKQVAERLRSGQRLRLDANRGWSLRQAVEFGRACQSLPIEFIEEPVDDPRECEAFWADTRVPYALDETVVEREVEVVEFPNVAALIVKPMLIGSESEISRLRSSGATKLVFSSAFETRIGLGHIVRIASRQSPDVPVGVDTVRWLRNDFAADHLLIDNSYVTARFPCLIDPVALEEVGL